MKQLVALALLTATVHAQPAASRKVSVTIATKGQVISAPTIITSDRECATLTHVTQRAPDLVAVAVCPVGATQLTVTWVVRTGDQTEAGGAVGSSAHGAKFSANFQSGLPHRYDVDVSVD